MKPSTEEIERHYFERFRELYPLPEGQITYSDKPDIILQGTRKVGIEVTNFFRQSGALPESEQRQRPLRDEMLASSQKLYLAGGGKRIEVSCGFDQANPITLGRKRKLPADLAALILALDNLHSGEIQKHLFRDHMPEVSFIYLNAMEYPDPKWRVVQSHKLGVISAEDLEVIVRGKEVKSAEYQACDSYWLLIVVDAMDAAQNQEIRVDGLRINSDIFERIIIFHTFGYIVEVKGASA